MKRYDLVKLDGNYRVIKKGIVLPTGAIIKFVKPCSGGSCEGKIFKLINTPSKGDIGQTYHLYPYEVEKL
jgi:hypothetical protein